MAERSSGLRANGIGLLGAATLGMVMLSPAMTLYGGFGPTFLAAGPAAPLAFVWALIATVPTAISYVLLSRDHPVSGSAASWAAMATTRKVGVWAGWIVFLYYFTNFVIQPVTLGVFIGDVFQFFGIPPGFAVYLLGVFLCVGWSAWIVYRGIAISTRGALGFLIFESAIVVALCLTIMVAAPTHGVALSSAGFHISASPTGSSGIFKAMVFAMLAYCGFDVVSTLAEETRMPEKLIPRATLLSLMLYAFFIVGGIWALTHGGDPAQLRSVAERGEMPISAVARGFWGKGSVLVTLTAISASLGLAIATAVGASRILFSMGRSGHAHPIFAVLSSRQVPLNALHFIFGIGIGAAVITGAAMGSYSSYVWWGTTSTYFAMITYLLVNLSNLILNRGRSLRSATNFALFCLIPLFGIGIDGYILVRTFFIELWRQGWATGQSVILADVLCSLIALVPAIGARARIGIPG